MSTTDPSRRLRARIAAEHSWAATADPTARTAPGRRASPGSVEGWMTRIDPEEAMPRAERERRARHALRAYMLELAARSAEVRRSRPPKKRPLVPTATLIRRASQRASS